MCERLNRLYDDAWSAYEDARPFLTPAQAVWSVETMDKKSEMGYRAVITQMQKARQRQMQELMEKLARLRALKLEVTRLEAEVKDAVIAGGETVKGPGITVSYTLGKKTYDWEAGARNAVKVNDEISDDQFAAIVAEHTKSPAVDWKKVASAVGATSAPFTQAAPGASVKVVDDEIAPFPDAEPLNKTPELPFPKA